MNKADEKRAFEQMMVEISDSDSDGEQESTLGNRPSVASAKRPVKSDAADSNQFASRAAPDRGTKMSSHDEEIENFGWRSSDRLEPTFMSPQMEQITTMKRWLLRPCAPKDPPVLCYVERHRVGFGRINPTYKCFLEGSDDQGPRFLMAAKKKSGSQTSYYLISLDLDDQSDRGSDSVLGKVRGNSVGSQYLITDSGIAPDKAVAPSMLRKELGLIRFEFDSGGPSRIEAFIPSVNAAGSASVWQPNCEEDGMNMKIDGGRYSNLMPLVNKKPKWDDTHGGHVLNFQGRVTESSVKNFQLCPADIPSSSSMSSSDSGPSTGVLNDDVILQFGRVAKHKFTLDVRYPMSPMQAFAISVACMDGKIADRKGYEYMRKLTGAAETTEHNQQAKGSVAGSKSFRGALSQSLPSSQYLKDKIARTFK